MSTPTGPKLEFIEAAETTISVQFKPVSSIDKYELEWRPIEQQWSSPAVGRKTVSVVAEGKLLKAEAENLEPGMTYCMRAFCIGSDGSKGQSAGPDLIIDTEQVGCTPKAEKSCCVIQ
eukprot:jgi/Psemu1/207071/e_gw1.425.26.1